MRLVAAVVLLLLLPAAARADAVIDAVNDERARRNLAPLVVSQTLERTSTSTARRLMREQRFDHDPLRPPGFGLFAEALMLDYTRSADPATAVE